MDLSESESHSDSATSSDGYLKMAVGREFLDFRGGEENRNGVAVRKGTAKAGLGKVRNALRYRCNRRDVLGSQRTGGPRRSGGGFKARWPG